MNHVFSITETDLPAIMEYYQDYLVPSEQEHILRLYQSDEVTVTLFRSGKVMLQGPSAAEDYLMWAEIIGFQPEITPKEKPVVNSVPEVKFSSQKAIGSDEVGTGDFFGPVVVCAALVLPKDYSFLQSIGVRDSKKLSDESILRIASELKTKISFQLLVTPNSKYNDLIDQGFNMNKIKAYLHNHAIRKLAQKHESEYEIAIIDEFCSKENYFDYLKDVVAFQNVQFVQKAEDKHLSVAAASILARASFLEEMDTLSQKIGIVLPLGASVAVDLIGKRIALEKGYPIFREIAKIHFKNMQKIKEMM